MKPYLFAGKFEPQTAYFICGSEALIRQAYYDSVRILTWSFGVTNRSGHRVERYLNAPASYQKCIDVYLWLLENYAQDVIAEFRGHEISLEVFTAALSFHWNTGAIRSATWPDLYKAGKMEAAEASFISWNKPPEIHDRRLDEANLLFRGKWKHLDGLVPEYTRVSPKGTPVWSSRKLFDMKPFMEKYADA